MKKAKRFIVGGLIIAAALILIIGLSSAIIRQPYENRYNEYTDKLELVASNAKLTGWNLLIFDADEYFGTEFMWAQILGCVICWFALLTALLTAIFGGLVMAKNSKKFRLTMLIVSVILQTIQSFLYMAFGVAVTAVFKSFDEICYTTAFVPFIFITMFHVAAFVCNFALRDEEKNTALSDNTAA